MHAVFIVLTLLHDQVEVLLRVFHEELQGFPGARHGAPNLEIVERGFELRGRFAQDRHVMRVVYHFLHLAPVISRVVAQNVVSLVETPAVL